MSCKKSFKERFYENYASDTELLKEHWEIKLSHFKGTWSIVENYQHLIWVKENAACVSMKSWRKIHIVETILQNKRSELIKKCKHVNHHTLLWQHSYQETSSKLFHASLSAVFPNIAFYFCLRGFWSSNLYKKGIRSL